MVKPESDEPDLGNQDEQSLPVSKPAEEQPGLDSEVDTGLDEQPPLQEEDLNQQGSTGADEDLPVVPEQDLPEQLKEAEERALRHQAELENVRKRMRRDLEDQQRFSGISLMRDLLPALDNLRRAIESADPAEANEAVLSGVQMVCEQLEGILAKNQCCRIEAEGQMFDPNLHEAVVQHPTSEHPPGTVIKEIQVGYRLYDRIVRPAQVMVAQSPGEEDPETQQQGEA